MDLKNLSLSDLDVLESNIWNAYNKAIDRTRLGEIEFIPIANNLEAKAQEVKSEINKRIESFINQ